MSTITRHLLLGVAALSIATSALAASQSGKASAQPSTSQLAKSGAGKSKPAPTTLAVSGKIVKFDATAQALTLSTSKGEEEFTLVSSTRLSSASHSISPNDLAGLSGRQATVRYQEASGQKTVLSVKVSPAPKTSAKH